MHILLSCCAVLACLANLWLEDTLLSTLLPSLRLSCAESISQVASPSVSARCRHVIFWRKCWRSLLMCASMHCETDLRTRILGNISKSSQDIWLHLTLTDCRYLHETCDLYFLQSPICRVMSCSILPMISCQRQKGGGAPRRNVFVSNRWDKRMKNPSLLLDHGIIDLLWFWDSGRKSFKAWLIWYALFNILWSNFVLVLSPTSRSCTLVQLNWFPVSVWGLPAHSSILELLDVFISQLVDFAHVNIKTHTASLWLCKRGILFWCTLIYSYDLWLYISWSFGHSFCCVQFPLLEVSSQCSNRRSICCTNRITSNCWVQILGWWIAIVGVFFWSSHHSFREWHFTACHCCLSEASSTFWCTRSGWEAGEWFAAVLDESRQSLHPCESLVSLRKLPTFVTSTKSERRLQQANHAWQISCILLHWAWGMRSNLHYFGSIILPVSDGSLSH